MIGVDVNWTGDTKFVHKMAQRGATAEFKRRVLSPWSHWVRTKRIIQMYKDGGKVSGRQGQKKWPRSRRATLEQKAHNKPMLSNKGLFGGMVRAYRIKFKRRGLRAWSMELTNSAKAKPWVAADGTVVNTNFDYPAYLHAGGSGRFTVRPRPGNPHGRLFWRVGGGQFATATQTRPRRPKARPHLSFYGQDLEQLGRRAIDWVLEGKTSGRGRKVS